MNPLMVWPVCAVMKQLLCSSITALHTEHIFPCHHYYSNQAPHIPSNHLLILDVLFSAWFCHEHTVLFIFCANYQVELEMFTCISENKRVNFHVMSDESGMKVHTL